MAATTSSICTGYDIICFLHILVFRRILNCKNIRVLSIGNDVSSNTSILEIENNIQPISRSISKVSKFFGIELDPESVKLSEWKEIPFSIKHGVYIITHGLEILYVGQGRVRRRQKHHIDNITGENLITKDSKGRTKSTKAWEVLRENRSINENYCRVIYMDCKTKYDAVAVEGALIKFLMPPANSETCEK